MKSKLIISLFSVLALSSGSLLAQGSSNAQADRPVATSSDAAGDSSFAGRRIVDASGKTLGTVQRVIRDTGGMTVRYAVVAVDGAKDTMVAVPWAAMKAGQGSAYVLNATGDQLAKAPRFVGDKANELLTPEGGSPVFKYWKTDWNAKSDLETSGSRQSSRAANNGTEVPAAAAESNSTGASSSATGSTTGAPGSDRSSGSSTTPTSPTNNANPSSPNR